MEATGLETVLPMNRSTEYKSCSDEELIDLLRNGEQEVVEFLLHKYKPMVRMKANALYLTGGETEDLVQEGMIGLYKAIRDYSSDKNTSFATFAQLCVNRHLYSVLEASGRKKNQPLNTAISLSSEVNQEGELLEDIIGSIEDDPENRVIEKEKIRELFSNLNIALSKLEAEVLRLHLEGDNYISIAEKLDQTPKSIDNALQRIRKKTKKLIREK